MRFQEARLAFPTGGRAPLDCKAVQPCKRTALQPVPPMGGRGQKKNKTEQIELHAVYFTSYRTFNKLPYHTFQKLPHIPQATTTEQHEIGRSLKNNSGD